MPNLSQIQKGRLTYLTIFIALVFVFEYVTRDFIWNLSIQIIPWMQTNLKFMIPFEHFLSFFGTERVMIIIMFIFYNFLNIYKTFILIVVISIANFLTGFLKMTYAQYRPYWVSEIILPYQCEAGWANPSGHSLCSMAFYLSMWKLIFYENEKELKTNSDKRYLFLSLIIFVIILICIGRLLLGVHGINQIILGCSLGFSIYYFIFFILMLNPDNPYQLFNFVSSDLGNFFLAHLGIFFAYSLLYYTLRRLNPNKIIFNDIVDLKGCGDIGTAKRFENDAYLNCTLIHLYLIAVIGIWVEYTYILNSNLKKWIEYNFGFHKHDENQRLLRKNYDTQWNHTDDFGTTSKRTLLTIIYFFIMMIPFFMISYNANMMIVVLFKIFLPSLVSIFLLFSYFKVFLNI